MMPRPGAWCDFVSAPCLCLVSERAFFACADFPLQPNYLPAQNPTAWSNFTSYLHEQLLELAAAYQPDHFCTLRCTPQAGAVCGMVATGGGPCPGMVLAPCSRPSPWRMARGGGVLAAGLSLFSPNDCGARLHDAPLVPARCAQALCGTAPAPHRSSAALWRGCAHVPLLPVAPRRPRWLNDEGFPAMLHTCAVRGALPRFATGMVVCAVCCVCVWGGYLQGWTRAPTHPT